MRQPSFQPTWSDLLFQKIFGGFGKWDAVYFLKIAEKGYSYEQYMAFFPLYPWILRTVTWIFTPAVKFLDLSQLSALLVCGWAVNSLFFTIAAVSLYKLTLRLFKRSKVALVSSLLFCINPASVFMSSLYTESLFCCLQFTALFHLEHEISIAVLLLFGLGCATRSNGILSCGFISHSILKHFLSTELASLMVSSDRLKLSHVFFTVTTILKLLLLNGIVLVPFILFQLYGYSLFCLPFTGDISHDKLSWCNNWLPFPYSHIQDTYWNVGFLRYFELKQIPNFFLAAPMLILSSCSVLAYCCHERNCAAMKTLGLLQRKHKQDNKAR